VKNAGISGGSRGSHLPRRLSFGGLCSVYEKFLDTFSVLGHNFKPMSRPTLNHERIVAYVSPKTAKLWRALAKKGTLGKVADLVFSTYREMKGRK